MGDGRSWGYAQAGAAIANFHDDAIHPSHIPWTKARARGRIFPTYRPLENNARAWASTGRRCISISLSLSSSRIYRAKCIRFSAFGKRVRIRIAFVLHIKRERKRGKERGEGEILSMQHPSLIAQAPVYRSRITGARMYKSTFTQRRIRA